MGGNGAGGQLPLVTGAAVEDELGGARTSL